MTSDEALEKLLSAYEGYYTIKKENVTIPFTAEAEFHCHTENYMLVKAAKIADIDSNEYIYFSIQPQLNSSQLSELSLKAWNAGLEKVKPYNGHRNSDVTLIVIADRFDENLKKTARKLHMSKNYNFGLYGWSNFRLAAIDLSDGNSVSNFQGRDIKKLFSKTGLSS